MYPLLRCELAIHSYSSQHDDRFPTHARSVYCATRYARQKNALGDEPLGHRDEHDHTSYDNVDDDDEPCDKSTKGDDSGANSSDPSIDKDLCNARYATNVGNNPSSMVNASIPNLVPRTNRKLLVYKYIQVR